MRLLVLSRQCLNCAEVDEAYWKRVVDNTTDTPITAPYSIAVAQASAHKEVCRYPRSGGVVYTAVLPLSGNLCRQRHL